MISRSALFSTYKTISACLAFSFAAYLGCFASLALAQESPKECFGQIQKHWEEGEWDQIRKLCTDSAFEEIIVSRVQAAGMMIGQDLGIPIPEMDDAKETLKSLFEDYGLDKIKFSSGVIITMDEEEIDEDEMKELAKKHAEDAKKAVKKIKEVLRKLKDRKDFEDELLDICSTSPLVAGQMTFDNSVVKKVEINDDSALMLVESDGDISRNFGGAQIVFQMPPRYFKFKKGKKAWKFDGLDQKKTAAAIELDR